MTTIKILPARIPIDLTVVRELFSEYAHGLGIDLGFQDFEKELATLPGKYATPSGRLLLAWDADQAVGCVALRQIDPLTCEIKRLFVKPGIRGARLGYRLGEQICNEARDAGYQRICLDTLQTMSAALRIYCSLGFQPIEPYVFNPIAGAIFLGRDLHTR